MVSKPKLNPPSYPKRKDNRGNPFEDGSVRGLPVFPFCVTTCRMTVISDTVNGCSDTPFLLRRNTNVRVLACIIIRTSLS